MRGLRTIACSLVHSVTEDGWGRQGIAIRAGKGGGGGGGGP